MRGALAPLAEREFRLLFLGRTVSYVGNSFAAVALAFAVLDVTGSKADLGYVLAARSVPQVVLLLAGGVWADRLPRHHVMVASNVASCASQAALAALLLTGSAHFRELIALGALNGASSAFFFPASTGIVPQTVPASLLQPANALLRLGLNASYIGGGARRSRRRGLQPGLGDRGRRGHLPRRRAARRSDALASGPAARGCARGGCSSGRRSESS